MTPVRRLRVRYPSEREDDARGWDAPREPVPALALVPRLAPEAVAPAPSAPAVPVQLSAGIAAVAPAVTDPAPEGAPPAAAVTDATDETVPAEFPARKRRRRRASPEQAQGDAAASATKTLEPAVTIAAHEPAATIAEHEPAATTAVLEPVASTSATHDTAVVETTAEPPTADVAVEPVPVPRTRRRQRLMAWAFGLMLPIAAFATGVLVFNSLVMPKLIHGGGDVEVPDLTHLTIDQAEQALTPLNLQLSRAGERFDPAVPRGFVLSQDPGPGIQVRGRRRVSVVVSLGEEFSSVPELRGESERGAFALLSSAGLRAGGITRAPSEDVGEGLVVTTDPPGASVLPHDQPVALLISAGSGPETYVMPDLVGRQVAGARRQLEAFGFRVLIPPAAPAMGSIVSQSPAPGSRISRTTTITIQASGRMIR